MRYLQTLLVVLFAHCVLGLNSCIRLPDMMRNLQPKDFANGAEKQALKEHIEKNTGDSINWWFILKSPGTASFLYYDSQMEAANAQSMIEIRSEEVLGSFLLWHTLNAHKENTELLVALNPKFYDEKKPYDRFWELENILENEEKLAAIESVLQLHIANDKGISRPQSYGAPQKNKDFRYSHGKGLFSVRLNEDGFGEAFHLQHSFTRAPVNEVRRGQAYLSRTEVNYGVKSQHAFCTSIGAGQVESFMESLAASGPKVVLINLDRDVVRYRIGGEKIDLIDKITDPEFDTECRDAWRALFTDVVEINDVLAKPVPEICHSPRTTYTSGGNLMVVIPHAPMPHDDYKLKLNEFQKTSPNPCNPVSITPEERIVRKKTHKYDIVDDDSIDDDDNIDDEETRRGVETPTGTEFEAVWLGPIPWLTTALVIDAPLLVSVWKHGDDLPAILADQCVFAVEDTCHTIGQDRHLGWGHHQMHEKIGVSSNPAQRWVCFGDSNHRFSEITHAGITICMKASNLWHIMWNAVKSVNVYEPVFAGGDCFPDVLDDDIVVIDNPISKWIFFKDESDHKKENLKSKRGKRGKSKRDRYMDAEYKPPKRHKNRHHDSDSDSMDSDD